MSLLFIGLFGIAVNIGPLSLLSFFIYVVALVFATMTFKGGYELTDTHLVFKQGLYSGWSMPLTTITRVRLMDGRLPLQGETKRIRIESPDKYHVIQLLSADDFLLDLGQRAPHLHRYGEELRYAPNGVLQPVD